MSDEFQLQITPKDEGSSRSLSKVRSHLIARGRRDAGLIAVPCNKCAERKDLVFAGCVCASCSDALDKQWASANTKDWVLVTTYSPFIDIMEALKRTLAIKEGKSSLATSAGAIPARREAGTVPNRYIYRDSTYTQMKSHWATCEPPSDFYLGPATSEEVAQARSLSAQQPDTPFIRPATPKEIAEDDARERDKQRDGRMCDIIAGVQEKWGFKGTGWREDGVGTPQDGVWDENADRRADEAFQEIRKRLGELGLLEGTPFEFGKGGRYVSTGFVETRRLANAGEAQAQFELGVRYLNAGDNAEAFRWYKRAADQGFAKAQYEVGMHYYDNESGIRFPVPQNHAEAMKWFRKAAEQGNADAQTSLGFAYAEGEGVPQDHGEAAKWLSLGDYNKGVMFETAEYYPHAVECYRRAAERDCIPAQLRLAYAYASGRGIAQDCAEAVKWYRKAAEQGVAAAQCNLGVAYYLGQGVAQDYAEAVKWYRKAAEQSVAAAQYNLGVAYADGKGVPQDYVLAHMYYNLATSKSSGEDLEIRTKARDDVAKKLTPQQFTEAQRLAREWKPQ
jgi:TPR repeat protein